MRGLLISRLRILVGLAAGILLLVGCGARTGAREAGQEHGEAGHPSAAIEMPHIHGLGFSADGRQLVVPAHDGLRIFADGKWRVPDGPAHDYMGYAPADDGFYSSGHPQPGSGLNNPLGLVKSTDDGQSLEDLGFKGESDFHLMGVGYRSHAIYLFNPAPNSRLAPGLHYSLDDGKSWKQTAAQGLDGGPVQIAVHPSDAAVVALATEGGLFLSSYYGDTFERIAAGPVSSAAFGPDGKRLFFGAGRLSAYSMESNQITTLRTPRLDAQDAIGYIAANPARPEELAVATFGRDIFRSTDGGRSWTQIAQDGRGM
jgi:hypothetical protein